MSDFAQYKITIDGAEEAEFLSKKAGCTLDEAERFLDAQYIFYEENGLVCEFDENEESPETAPVVDSEIFFDFICRETGLPVSLVAKLDYANLEFIKIFEQVEAIKNNLLDLSIELEEIRPENLLL